MNAIWISGIIIDELTEEFESKMVFGAKKLRKRERECVNEVRKKDGERERERERESCKEIHN